MTKENFDEFLFQLNEFYLRIDVRRSDLLDHQILFYAFFFLFFLNCLFEFLSIRMRCFQVEEVRFD